MQSITRDTLLMQEDLTPLLCLLPWYPASPVSPSISSGEGAARDDKEFRLRSFSKPYKIARELA